MNSLTQNEMFHEYPSSPTRRSANYHTQSLNRQGSRGFDPFSGQNGIYGSDDATTGYDTSRFNERMTPAMQNSFNAFDANMSQAWNASYNQNNTLAALGATGRRNNAARNGRAPLPQTWLDQTPMYGYPNAQPAFGGMPMQESAAGDDEELIPTAIVIKNIPFAVKKEQLVEIMTRSNLPLPYAFNYHFDNGVFRGLAFANFTTAEETQTVIQHMNGRDLNGRRLRVEYKKMLPQAERDRIEREKRERRGQLEEQHRPNGPQLQPSSSMSSMAGGMQARTPSPGAARNPHALDMNDPVVLSYYGKLLLFQTDRNQGEVVDFPPQLPPEHRKIIHGLAHNLGLSHHSEGVGSQRFVRVGRNATPNPSMGLSSVDALRRGLHRAATTDFSQARSENNYGTGRDMPPFLGLHDAPPSLSTSALRAAKSHADLRSYTPSPAQSAASFPANVNNNFSRYDYNYNQESPNSSRPNLTPTTMAGNTEDFLTNGFGNLNINYSHPQGSPQRSQGGGLRPTVSWDRQSQPGPIGGHRAASTNVDESTRTRTSAAAPLRQPRGPAPGQGSGFPRPGAGRGAHRTRGSDELSSPVGVEGIAE